VFALYDFYVHLVIAHETPKRIGKCSRFIFFYKKMSNPCEGIARQQRIKKVHKIKAHEKPYVKIQTYRCAYEMQKFGVFVAVFAYVIRIKVLKARKPFHCHPNKTVLNQTAINQNRY
jgi:hypothetical protein